MSLVVRLVLANLRQHPGRLALTAAAVIAAACVVVWVTSGYDALLAQVDEFADEYLGRYQLVVVPDVPNRQLMPGAPIDPRLIDLLRQDPAVAALDPLVQSRVREVTGVNQLGATGVSPVPHGQDARGTPRGDALPSSFGKGAGGEGQARRDVRRPPRPHPSSLPEGERTANAVRRSRARPPGPFFLMPPTLVGTDATEPPHEMLQGKWIDPTRSNRAEGVLSSKTARQLGIRVGQQVLVRTDAGKFRLKIIGIVRQISVDAGDRGPRAFFDPMRGPATNALYVPVALAEKISGVPAKISCVNMALRDGEDAEVFRRRWNDRIKQEHFAACVFNPADVEADMKEGFSAAHVRNQAWSATGISLLAALFIILTTLSMGVHERTRQFAVLRAVALTRAQVAAMIAVEGLLLAMVGWAGGLAAGWGLLVIMAQARPGLFAGGVSLGPWAVGLSGVCAVGGALAASVLPAAGATRVSPLEAMTPRPLARPARLSWIAVAAGAALVAVNPLLVFVVPMADESRYGIYAALGCMSMAIGFVLLAPLAILATERILGPVVAAVMRLDTRLLETQLSSNLWRTLGTTVALSLGLGLFVAIETWGYSMLRPFVPGDWAPDALVCFTAGGLPEEEIDAVAHIKGVDSQRCLALAVEQPKLAEDITGSRQRLSVARQDNVIMIGLDPRLALTGSDPPLTLEFVEGTREDALKRLADSRGCIVPDHFARTTGLRVGDRFKLLPPESPNKPVEYSIAGVVSLPGWHWMTKFSGLRRRGDRTAAMIFASRENVRRDFELDKTNFVWLDLRPGASLDRIGMDLQAVAARHPGEPQPVNAQGRWAFAARTFGPSVRITTAEDIRERINARADSMIWGMCQLPLVTLLVTSLGVANAVLASVRARRWEMGVLRAVGLTRCALARLILAEAILIGVVACLLSLGFGVMAGWCGMGMSQYVSFFGGLAPSLVIPWPQLSIGVGATLALCLVAAIWPATAVGRAEPLRLLQTGRSAM